MLVYESTVYSVRNKSRGCGFRCHEEKKKNYFKSKTCYEYMYYLIIGCPNTYIVDRILLSVLIVVSFAET